MKLGFYQFQGTIIKDYTRLIELESKFKVITGKSIEDMLNELLSGTAKITYDYSRLFPKVGDLDD